MASTNSPAYAFHHRFSVQPQGQNGNGQPASDPSAADGQPALPRTSTDNISYPDLDGGQYYSSAAPHMNGGAAHAPISGAPSSFANFPEFKGLDFDSSFDSEDHFARFRTAPTATKQVEIEGNRTSFEPQIASPKLSISSSQPHQLHNQQQQQPQQQEAAEAKADAESDPHAVPTHPLDNAPPQSPPPTSAADAYNQPPQRGFSSASSYQAQRQAQLAPNSSHPDHSNVPTPPAKSPHRASQMLPQQANNQQVESEPRRSESHNHSNGLASPSNESHGPSQTGHMSQSFVFPSSRAPASPPNPATTAALVNGLNLDQLNMNDGHAAAGHENGPTQRAEPATDRSRPSSFFGMERPVAALNASGQHVPVPRGLIPDEEPATARAAGLSQADDLQTRPAGIFVSASYPVQQRDPGVGLQNGARPSSFFGMEGTAQPPASGSDSIPGSPPTPDNDARAHPSRGSSYHRSESSYRGISTAAGGTGNGPMPPPTGGFGGLGPSGATRPASIAPTISSGPLLDHSHLKPGQKASLLSHGKTLELYRQNAKKTNDPNLIYELAVFMIDASKSMGSDDGSGGSGSKEDTAKDELVKEATGLLKKIADRGHPDAQYFLADCYANGIGTTKGKQDFGSAYTYFVLAAKHGHPDAAYRAGTCYEKGWGCRRDNGKALQFYRKAAAQNHPGAMYRLATAELNGELGLKKSAKEGVKWLKRSAEAATPEFPHALHELALLHERGIDNVLFVDPEYSCELLAQAGEMGYAPSAYKLGVNYEYGRMGCPQDGGLSIHMYNIAAQQNHKEACFALTAWYLVGAPGILPQSDTEAYLWAKKAAEQGLAKAEYAVGYFTEMGIGTVKDLAEAKAWYRRAAEHGDKRANQRIAALGGRPEKTLAGVGAGANSTDYGKRGQPSSAPFPGSYQQSSMTPSAQMSYPTPIAMREAQTAQRESQYLANVAAAERAQAQARQPARPPPSSMAGGRPPQQAGQSPSSMPQSPFPPRPFSQAGAYPSHPFSASTAAPMSHAVAQPPNGMPGPQIPMSPPGMTTSPGGIAPEAAAGDDGKKKKKWFGRS